VTSDEQDVRLSKLREALSSRDGRLVLRGFRRRPDIWLSLVEVCSIARLPLSQGSGAIRGFRGRYNPDLSLLSLGLIEEKEVKVSPKRSRKLYKFNVKNQSTLDLIDHVLEMHHVEEP